MLGPQGLKGGFQIASKKVQGRHLFHCKRIAADNAVWHQWDAKCIEDDARDTAILRIKGVLPHLTATESACSFTSPKNHFKLIGQVIFGVILK